MIGSVRAIAFPPMMRRRLAPVAVLIVLVLVAAGCGRSGEPETFDEQFVELSPEEQVSFGVSDAEVPVEFRNWMEGCVGAAGTGDATVSNPAKACRCSFDDIKTFVLDFSTGATAEEKLSQAFETFKDLDQAAEDGTPFQIQIQEIIEACNT
jgi:hypothetical protein